MDVMQERCKDKTHGDDVKRHLYRLNDEGPRVSGKATHGKD